MKRGSHLSAETRQLMSEAQLARHRKIRLRLPPPAAPTASNEPVPLVVETRVLVRLNGQALDLTLDDARALQQALTDQLSARTR